MHIALLLALIAVGYAADPFASPALDKASASIAKDQAACLDALVDAWYASDVHPVVIPTLGPDPREHERMAAMFGEILNQRIVSMNKNYKRWKTLDTMTLEQRLEQAQKERVDFMTALAQAEKYGVVLPMRAGKAEVNPFTKVKPKITATLADGTVVEQ
jgi:hypothetical protein